MFASVGDAVDDESDDEEGGIGIAISEDTAPAEVFGGIGGGVAVAEDEDDEEWWKWWWW